MGIARIAKNVVTLGGHAKLVTAGRLYEEACLRHRAAHTQAQALKARADAEIAALGAETRKAMRVLRRAHSLLSVAGGYRPRLLSVEVSSAAPSLPGARIAAAALASYSSTAEALDAAKRMRGMIPVAANARGVLLEERIALEAEERVARKAVWPLGRISRIWRAAKKAFGRAGLTEAETVA